MENCIWFMGPQSANKGEVSNLIVDKDFVNAFKQIRDNV